MRITGGLERENDRLIQVWATKQRSYVSMKPSQCGHHYYSRYHKLLRWDLKNIIPLTLEEHTQLHSGKLTITLPEDRQEYLDTMVNRNYKNYLLENNLTDEEFVMICNKKLKEKISELS